MTQLVMSVSLGPFGQPGRFMLQEYAIFGMGNAMVLKTRKGFCGPLFQEFDLLSSSDILLFFFLTQGLTTYIQIGLKHTIWPKLVSNMGSS